MYLLICSLCCSLCVFPLTTHTHVFHAVRVVQSTFLCLSLTGWRVYFSHGLTCNVFFYLYGSFTIQQLPCFFLYSALAQLFAVINPLLQRVCAVRLRLWTLTFYRRQPVSMQSPSICLSTALPCDFLFTDDNRDRFFLTLRQIHLLQMYLTTPPQSFPPTLAVSVLAEGVASSFSLLITSVFLLDSDHILYNFHSWTSVTF